MRYRKIAIYVLTVLFLVLAAFVGYNEVEWEPFPFSVVLSTEEGTEQIQCWKEVPDAYYVFLPGYADLSRATLRANRFHEVYVDGQQIIDGMSCEAFPLDVPLDMAYTNGRQTHHQTIAFTQSANVATMYIDVSSGSMDYVHKKKGNTETGVMRLYTSDGALQYRGDLKSIKGRGNATWFAEKKPYSLKLPTDADLLGMGTASEWILLANAYDESHLRNKIAYDFAASVGLPYSPECTWVDLYINGEYRGLYLLSERIEVHPQRVDIEKDSSFLVSIELLWRLDDQGYPYILSDYGNALRIHHAGIGQNMLRQVWQSAENAIYSENGVDPATGKSWREWIDMDSWAKKFLLEEALGNYDACAISQFFYYDESNGTGKIYAGPIWDMDNTLACGEWQALSPYAILAGRQHLWNEQDSPLFYALYQKPEFYDRVVQLYREEFQPQLAWLLDEGLDQYAAQVSKAASMDKVRWNGGDAAENTEKIRIYMEERMEFLADLWLKDETFYRIHAFDGLGIWSCLAVRPGEDVSWLPVYDNTAWYTIDTDEPFDITAPVYRDATIYLKTLVPETSE